MQTGNRANANTNASDSPQTSKERKYSPIGPISILESLLYNNALGDYLLLLAHDVLTFPDRYRALVAAQRVRTPGLFIIMDNSVIELGHSMSAEKVAEAARIVNADVMMLPDILGDSLGTINLCRSNIEHYRQEFKLMFVPQGNSQQEINESIDWYYAIQELRPIYFGVPRWIANKLGSRGPTLDYIGEQGEYWGTYAPNIKIHMLGMSSNFKDDIEMTKRGHVMGIDSANPLVIGQRFIDLECLIIDNKLNDVHMDRGDYMDSNIYRHAGISTLNNIAYVRELINQK